jgi:chorismate dehydratase
MVRWPWELVLSAQTLRNHIPVPNQDQTHEPRPINVGAVEYLNARPLTLCLDQFVPAARIVTDIPSRLADGLAVGDLDVALIPSIEYFRNPDFKIVSDACIGCDGPVESVKLFSRVPIEQIRSLALDDGSRTSAAMTQILLKEKFGLEPAQTSLPIGAPLEDIQTDAVMLIGDRAMLPSDARFEHILDLGEAWCGWTGLPFVFAMWAARPGVKIDGLPQVFAAARNAGTARIDEIARFEAPRLQIAEERCRSYLRHNLRFRIGRREERGLEKFRQLATQHGLAPHLTKDDLS